MSAMMIDEIMTIISVQLGIQEIPSEAHIIQDLGAESADIVGIVAALEDKYGIMIEEGELAEIQTVVELTDLVQKKLPPDK
jgi:acyl carrier protein